MNEGDIYYSHKVYCINNTVNKGNSSRDRFCHHSDLSYPRFLRKKSIEAKSHTLLRNTMPEKHL